MNWSDIPWTPSNRMLRQFAGLWMVCLAGIGGWHGFVLGHAGVVTVCAVLAATVGPLGLMKPRAVRPIFLGSILLAFPVGWAVSRLLLALVFYAVFSPLALVFRLMGRDALCLRHRADRATYWTPTARCTDLSRYFRPF